MTSTRSQSQSASSMWKHQSCRESNPVAAKASLISPFQQKKLCPQNILYINRYWALVYFWLVICFVGNSDIYLHSSVQDDLQYCVLVEVLNVVVCGSLHW